jgi:predicted dehydrogenase
MNTLPRRQFIATSTAAAASALVSARAQESKETDDAPKLKLGLIASGWWGMVDARAALKAGDCEIVAVCDVDEEHLSTAANDLEKEQGSRPQTFKNYADLLAIEDLDGLILATPPHWRALPFVAACERGLDVYLEKPIAYDVREGQAMVAAAKKAGNIVQVGFQRRNASGFNEAKRYIQDGKAGKIVSVEAQINVPLRTESREPIDPPTSLDWDQWCGPAPLLPYSKAVGHFHWRQEKTTGNGHLVDWGIHLVDAARTILEADAPKSVTSTGGLYQLGDHITTPDILTSHFEFADFPLTWHHRAWGTPAYHRSTSNGVFFFGEKETVFCTDDRWIVKGHGRGDEEVVHEARNDSSMEHMAEFLTAVRNKNNEVSCAIEDGHHSTTAVELAMISYETGTRVNWDAATNEITNSEAAAKLLKRDYRAPYEHPWKG